MSITNLINADNCHLMESAEDSECAESVAHEIQGMTKRNESDAEEDEGPVLPSTHLPLEALHLVMKINEVERVVRLHLARALRCLKRDVKQLRRVQQRQTLVDNFFIVSK